MPAPGQPENAEFPGEFIPSPSGKNCDKFAGGWGIPMTDYEYIWYSNADENSYPEEACKPYYHKNAQIDNLQVNQNLTANGTVTGTEVIANGITLTSRKPFDIPHPTKNGWRLRHVCLEGPESGVYYRGRLKNENVIELPEYWSGLVDPESITVTLTQIGYSQDLIVEKIEWGKKILIKSGTGANIDCYFMVNGERKDGEKLIVEYEGNEIDDYPGDNSIYSINK